MKGRDPLKLPPVNFHSGFTVWFTGLSGSGKSTLSQAVAGMLDNLDFNVKPQQA